MKKVEVVCIKCEKRFITSDKIPFVKGYPKRSFLGFLIYKCPNCKEKIIYPLTRGYRIIWWIVTILLILSFEYFISQGQLPIPGFLGLAAIFALLKDQSIRNAQLKKL